MNAGSAYNTSTLALSPQAARAIAAHQSQNGHIATWKVMLCEATPGMHNMRLYAAD